MELITRAQWGANPRETPASRNIEPQRGGVAVHYEGSPVGNRPHDRCDDAMRSIQRFHIQGRGWADFAYSLAVCQHGSVFEGRGVYRRTAANGTVDGNDRFYAVCALIGSGDTPTQELLVSIKEAITYLRQQGGAGSRVVGHRDLFNTDCPGEPLYRWLKAGMPTPGDGDHEEEPMKLLCKLSLATPVTIEPGKTAGVTYQIEYDPEGMHHPSGSSIFPKAARDYGVWARARVDRLPAGERVSLHLSRVDRRTSQDVNDLHVQDFIGDGEPLRVTIYCADFLDATKYGLRLNIENRGPSLIEITESQFRLAI